MLLSAISPVLGVLAGCRGYVAEMYGVPSADYEVKGCVTSPDGAPIPGIGVSTKHVKDTTDQQGRYHLRWQDYETNSISIIYQDIDRNENGLYRDTVVSEQLRNSDFRGGDGEWYIGTASKNIDVTLQPAADDEQ